MCISKKEDEMRLSRDDFKNGLDILSKIDLNRHAFSTSVIFFPFQKNDTRESEKGIILHEKMTPAYGVKNALSGIVLGLQGPSARIAITLDDNLLKVSMDDILTFCKHSLTPEEIALVKVLEVYIVKDSELSLVL